MRVYELAKLLDINNKDLLALLAKLNVSVKTHMSTIDDDTIQLVEDELDKARAGKNKTAKTASKSEVKAPAKPKPSEKNEINEKQPFRRQKLRARSGCQNCCS